MRKLFNKKQKKRVGDLKIPIPMLSDSCFLDMPESHIATLLGQPKRIGPRRSVSSPASLLVMPKPIHCLPPTQCLLGTLEHEKTQIEEKETPHHTTNKERNRTSMSESSFLTAFSSSCVSNSGIMTQPSVSFESNDKENSPSAMETDHCRPNASLVGSTSADTTEDEVVQDYSKSTDKNNSPTFLSSSSSLPQDTMDIQSMTELIQSQMKKMALNEDLLELKRTVDRIQQQRASDLEEHVARIKEQKKREKEILDQINTTNQRLEMAIAGKLFHPPESQGDANETTNQKTPTPKASHSTQRASRHYRHRPRPHRPSFYEDVNPYFPEMNPLAFDDFIPPPPPLPYLQQQEEYLPYDPRYEFMMRNGIPPPLEFMMEAPLDPPSSQFRKNRNRSKSLESKWPPHDMMFDPDPSLFYQESRPFASSDNMPPTPRSRSRKSSLHSAKSNLSDQENDAIPHHKMGVELHDNPVPSHLSTSGESSKIHKDENPAQEDNQTKQKHRFTFPRMNPSGRSRVSSAWKMKRHGNPQQQEEEEEEEERGEAILPPPLPPSFMYPNSYGFPPPPPLFESRPTKNERRKMNPPYGAYHNLPPRNGYIPHQKVSPDGRMFVDEPSFGNTRGPPWTNIMVDSQQQQTPIDFTANPRRFPPSSQQAQSTFISLYPGDRIYM